MESSRLATPPIESTPPAAHAPEVSVVIPCLNEAATVATCIRKAQRALAELDATAEIVVADNGSDEQAASRPRAART
jgi:hypothetical protein